MITSCHSLPFPYILPCLSSRVCQSVVCQSQFSLMFSLVPVYVLLIVGLSSGGAGTHQGESWSPPGRNRWSRSPPGRSRGPPQQSRRDRSPPGRSRGPPQPSRWDRSPPGQSRGPPQQSRRDRSPPGRSRGPPQWILTPPNVLQQLPPPLEVPQQLREHCWVQQTGCDEALEVQLRRDEALEVQLRPDEALDDLWWYDEDLLRRDEVLEDQ
uniref:Uncharacterized protein n=1 Tax=Cyprinus carpio carpio TaxID=630221 RepID=A0A9J7YRX2_CYPCA